MSRIAVEYQGQPVGFLAEARGGIFFEYDQGWIATGHELSPLHLPSGPGVRGRESTPSMRLPGLFEDSLPDSWGRRLMMDWFRQNGIPEHAVTPLMMLAYVGHRAMGALVYHPELTVAPAPADITLAEIQVAVQRAESAAGQIDLSLLAEIGSSAGGARPKAVIGLHRGDPRRLIPGAGELPPEFDAWIVKFDLGKNAALGPLEEAYARMARAAGIEVPETRLLETSSAGRARRHFAVRRFDREGPVRIHHHTLAAMCHVGGADLDYGTFLRVTRLVTRDEREVWRAYRRAVFNVMAGNRDDHGKNHGFLYRDRQWQLGPPYDLTFTSRQQLPERGMAVVGERRRAGRCQLMQLAEGELLDRRRVLDVIEEVQAAIGRWPEFAEGAGVPPRTAAEVGTALIESVAETG